MEQIKKDFKDLYEVINEQVLSRMTEGKNPWTGGFLEPPTNALNNHQYRGINHVLLNSLGHERNVFLSYKQARSIGANIRRGEHGQLILFYTTKEKFNEHTGQVDRKRVLKCHRVFNISQCENLPKNINWEKPIAGNERDNAEEIIANTKNSPSIYQDEASYNADTVSRKKILIPPIEDFPNIESYYDYYFKILAQHNLENLERGEDIPTIQEESMIKEMTASQLLGRCGYKMDKSFSQFDKAKLESCIAEDKRFLVQCASQSQKIHDKILGVERVREEETQEKEHYEHSHWLTRQEELEEFRKSVMDREVWRGR